MWTIEGTTPVTVCLYEPAITIQCGDGPEVPLPLKQFHALSERFDDIECFFDCEDPDVL